MPRSVSRQSVDSDLDSVSSTDKPHTPAASEPAAGSQPPSPAKKRRKAARSSSNVHLPSPAPHGVAMAADMPPPTRLHMPPDCVVAQNPFEDSLPRLIGPPHHMISPHLAHSSGHARFLYPVARPLMSGAMEQQQAQQPMGLPLAMMRAPPQMQSASQAFSAGHQPSSMFGPTTNSSGPPPPFLYPCGSCHKEVQESEQAILCESGCNSWFHRQCSGLSEFAYQLLNKEVFAEWVCDQCLSKKNIPVIKLCC